MLTASDFNKVFEDYAEQILYPQGFRKSGTHYYKQSNKQYYAVIKDTSRGYFLDYYLTYSPEAAGTQFEILSKKPSVKLNDYPVSVAIDDLRIIYNNNEKLIDSPYYFYSLSREYKIDRSCKETIDIWNEYFSKIVERNKLLSSDKNYLENYVKGLFQIISNEGFRFFGECSFDLCYKSMLRPLRESKMQQYSQHYEKYLDHFNKYAVANNIQIPEFDLTTKKKWFNKWFNRN
jgi:hypothetical protein